MSASAKTQRSYKKNSLVWLVSVLAGTSASASTIYAPIDGAILPVNVSNHPSVTAPPVDYWLKINDGAVPDSDAFVNISQSPNGLQTLGYEIASAAQLDKLHPFNESNVFFRNINHGGSNRWEMHVMPSGAIYSLRLPDSFGTRELICCQDWFGSEWTDRVIQFNPYSLPDVNLQQAGTSNNSNQTSLPAGNVRLFTANLGNQNIVYNNTTVGFSTVSVPLVANGSSQVGSVHPPSDKRTWEWLLLQQHIRDLGHGKVEVTYIAHNFNPNNVNYNYVVAAWAGFTFAAVPVTNSSVGASAVSTYGSNVWGSASGWDTADYYNTTYPQAMPHVPNYFWSALAWHPGDGSSYAQTWYSSVSSKSWKYDVWSPSDYRAAGYVSFAQSASNTAPAIGIVYGKDDSTAATPDYTDPNKWNSSWGWNNDNGTYQCGYDWPGRTEAQGGNPNVNGHPACDPNHQFQLFQTSKTQNSGTGIPAGTVWYYRYYLVFDTAGNIISEAPGLQNTVSYGQLPAFSNAAAKKLSVASRIAAAGASLPTNWNTLDTPVANAAPLFLALNQSGTCCVVTANPRLWSYYTNGPSSITNGDTAQQSTKLVSFLGYGVRTPVGSTTPPAGFTNVTSFSKLSSVLSTSFPDYTANTTDADLKFDVWVPNP